MRVVSAFSNQLLQENNFFFYMLILFSSVISHYLIQSAFFTEELYYNTFGEQITLERVHKLFEMGSRYKILNYLIIPFTLGFKILYNSLWVSVACFFKTGKDNFESNFSICLKSEVVFLIMILVNLINVFFFKEISTLDDLNPVPFSLLSFFNPNDIPVWLKYPLQTSNIWEVGFCIVGSSLYSIKYSISFGSSLVMFAIPYLVGLFVFIVFVMFIVLQFS